MACYIFANGMAAALTVFITMLVTVQAAPAVIQIALPAEMNLHAAALQNALVVPMFGGYQKNASVACMYFANFTVGGQPNMTVQLDTGSSEFFLITSQCIAAGNCGDVQHPFNANNNSCKPIANDNVPYWTSYGDGSNVTAIACLTNLSFSENGPLFPVILGAAIASSPNFNPYSVGVTGIMGLSSTIQQEIDTAIGEIQMETPQMYKTFAMCFAADGSSGGKFMLGVDAAVAKQFMQVVPYTPMVGLYSVNVPQIDIIVNHRDNNSVAAEEVLTYINDNQVDPHDLASATLDERKARFLPVVDSGTAELVIPLQAFELFEKQVCIVDQTYNTGLCNSTTMTLVPGENFVRVIPEDIMAFFPTIVINIGGTNSNDLKNNSMAKLTVTPQMYLPIMFPNGPEAEPAMMMFVAAMPKSYPTLPNGVPQMIIGDAALAGSTVLFNKKDSTLAFASTVDCSEW